MRKSIVCTLVACLILSATPYTVAADSNEDIPTNAAATGVHNTLVQALAHVDLVSTLEGTGPFTVFAPTDQAFLDAGINLDDFNNDAANSTLIDILTYHVVSGSVMSTDLTDGGTADALNGDKMTFSVSTSEVKVNGATVTSADVVSSNGVIHVIDKVLAPPIDVFVSNGDMSAPYYNFYMDSSGNYPLTEIDISMPYKFHRLSNPSTHPFYISDTGYKATPSGNLVIVGDGSHTSGISNDESFTVFFKDGFGVDDTLNFFCTVHSNMIGEFALTAPTPEPVTLDDIPTIATNSGVHDVLVNALTKADLVSTLQTAGPYTVFAPTDTAFSDAGIDLDDFSTESDVEVLTSILLYHVYSGSVAAADVTDGMTATMVNGESASFTVTSDAILINDATVIVPDILASNGVVHVIDEVLFPPSFSVDDESDDNDDGDEALTPELALEFFDTNDDGYLSWEEFWDSWEDSQEGEDGQEEMSALMDIFADSDTNADELLEISELETFIYLVGEFEHDHDGHDNDDEDGHDHGGDGSDDGETDWEVYPNGYCEWEGDPSSSENVWDCKDAESDTEWDTWWYYCELRGSDWYCTDDYGQDAAFEFTSVIPAIASSTGIHTALLQAITVANLELTLQNEGPFTVFAPSDEAFAKAGIDLSTYESDEDITALSDTLLYHVVPSSIFSSDLAEGDNVVTAANGDELTVTLANGAVTVGAQGASVTIADVLASNGVIHVIDTVLTPPVEAPDPFDGVNCVVTIGLTESGLGFSPSYTEIEVGDTVCWSWTDATMEHNVKQVDGFESSTYVDGGVYSGPQAVTVAFHHTFTENQTFYYACEPHLSSKMFGEIVVGDGGVEPATDKKESEDTPGFLAPTMVLAILGAVLFTGHRRSD